MVQSFTWSLQTLDAILCLYKYVFGHKLNMKITYMASPSFCLKKFPKIDEQKRNKIFSSKWLIYFFSWINWKAANIILIPPYPFFLYSTILLCPHIPIFTTFSFYILYILHICMSGVSGGWQLTLINHRNSVNIHFLIDKRFVPLLYMHR